MVISQISELPAFAETLAFADLTALAEASFAQAGALAQAGFVQADEPITPNSPIFNRRLKLVGS